MFQRILSAGLMFAAVSSATLADEPTAKPSPANPIFEKVKKLVGTWVEADKDGKPTDKVVSVVKLTANGSTVQETLFPGEKMEMLSIYHQDKNDVVMTHYCSLGNQPRLKADPKSSKNQIKWLFTGGSNLDPAKDMHMHESTVTFLDDDHIEIAGVAWVDGKPSETHCGTMKLVRKK